MDRSDHPIDQRALAEAAAACRGFLLNAAARQRAVAAADPETPSVDYLVGFGAGRQAGEVEALALALSALTGESATALVEEARSQAAVDAAFPFDLHVHDEAGAA